MTINARPHGRFLAAEAGELAGVSGTTIGQWARRGLIRSSVSDEDPRVYSVEDVAEARSSAHCSKRIRHTRSCTASSSAWPGYGRWPLQRTALGTTPDVIPRIVLREDEADWVLTARGWQRPATPITVREVRLRLKRSA